jgi:OmpA-OmpF porin, OOP family
VAGLLKKDPALKIQVVGHTDTTGNAAANQDLSTRRAETVKKTLAERYGADATRITSKGYGADQPLAQNDTDENRSINRRVEIVLVQWL